MNRYVQRNGKCMRDVVVIGGGLSGLAACRELERLGARYTVIEVKRRFGGGIRSSSAGGFVMDGCAFVFQALDDSRLDWLGLRGQQSLRGDGSAVMRGGSESLIHALAAGLRGGRLTRMALSSIGRLGGRFTLCLENGLMLDAGALILAVPARYAARMLYNLCPDTARLLAEFRYESIARVSLGCRKTDLPAAFSSPPADCAFLLQTDAPGRVPDSQHVLLQLGLRCDAAIGEQELIAKAVRYLGIRQPIAAYAHRWAEADLLSSYDAEHAATIRAIRAALPAGISLIGSDYCLNAPQAQGIARLDERLDMGRDAARAAVGASR